MTDSAKGSIDYIQPIAVPSLRPCPKGVMVRRILARLESRRQRGAVRFVHNRRENVTEACQSYVDTRGDRFQSRLFKDRRDELLAAANIGHLGVDLRGQAPTPILGPGEVCRLVLEPITKGPFEMIETRTKQVPAATGRFNRRRSALRLRQPAEALPNAEPARHGVCGLLGQNARQHSSQPGFERTFPWSADPGIAGPQHRDQFMPWQFIQNPAPVPQPTILGPTRYRLSSLRVQSVAVYDGYVRMGDLGPTDSTTEFVS